VRDDHVTKRPCLLVELSPALDSDGLWHVNLHVADVVATPDRLKEPVGEAQGEDVVHGFLAEEMVNPEHLGLSPI